MHFITKGFKRFSYNNSHDSRQHFALDISVVKGFIVDKKVLASKRQNRQRKRRTKRNPEFWLHFVS